MQRSNRILVMTGGTSGFGRRMLERLLREHREWQAIVLARPSPHCATLEAEFAASGRLTIIESDLSRLGSVEQAIGQVRQTLDDQQIDALVLNAGVQVVEGDRISADGIELTFAVNHLAHFFLADSLAPQVLTGGRTIFTASEVHDPAAFCLLGITRAAWQPPADLADAGRAQMHLPEGVERGEARYSASKLLNLMSARFFAAHQPRFSTFAFNPSVVPGTDIARERNFLQILAWKTLLPALAPILPGARSLARSAGDLLWLAMSADAASLRGQYVNGRRVELGSEDSRDMGKINAVAAVSRALIARHVSAPPHAIVVP